MNGAAPGHLPFVGRERELKRLAQVESMAKLASGSVVLISGEPGVGKTRFLRELALRGDPTVAYHQGRCDETPGARRFWPWTLILRSYRAHASAEDQPRLSAALQELRPLLPDLQDDEDQNLDFWSDQRRFWLFDRVAEFLRAEAQRAPQMLVIDDLHCGDPASLLLFEFLAHRVSDVPIVLVGAYRPGPRAHDDVFPRVIGALVGAPHVTRIELRGLDADGVAELVRMELEARESQAPDVIQALRNKTNGNPLYLLQILRDLRSGSGAGVSLVERIRSLVPDSVQEAVEHRIRALPLEARRVLDIAAVEGRRFQSWIAAQVSGLSLEVVGSALDASQRAGLVEVSSEGLGYEFCHLLVRDAIYARISPHERARLHRGVAESIEGRIQCEIKGELTVLAHHYLRAASDGCTLQAVHYAQAAAAEAVRGLAFENGVELYRQTLEVLEASQEAEPRRVARLLLAMGDAQNRAGDGQSSIHTFDRAARIARHVPDAELLAYAVLGVGLRFGQVFELGHYDPTQIALIEESLALLPEEARSLRAQLWARLATSRFWAEDPETCVAYARRAVQIARACESEYLDPLFDALASQYLASTFATDAGDSSAIAQQLLDVAARTRNPEHRLRSRVIAAADTWMRTSERSAVDVQLEQLRALADELQLPAARWWCLGFEATNHFVQGRAENGLATAEEAFRLGAKAGTHMVEATLAGHRYSYCMLRGEWQELDALLAGAVERFPRLAAFRCARIFSRLKVGDISGARSAFEAAIDQDQTQLRAPLVNLMCQAMLAEVCFELGDAKRAPLLEAALLRSRCQNVIAGVGGVFHGPIQRYLGLLAAAVGDLPRARKQLALARRSAQRLGAEPWVLRVELDQIRLALREDPAAPVAKKIRKLRTTALSHGWHALCLECESLAAGRETAARESRPIEREPAPPSLW